MDANELALAWYERLKSANNRHAVGAPMDAADELRLMDACGRLARGEATADQIIRELGLPK